MTDNSVTSALRALREEARIGVREMARRLGVSTSSYSHYEDPKRFKDKYLPMAWAIRFADVLEDAGINRARVLMLAGSNEIRGSSPIDERFRLLSPKRQQLLMSILTDLEAAEEIDRAPEGSGSAADHSKP